MNILAITSTETYAINDSTMTLFDPKGNFLTKGFLRIMYAMRKKDIIGIERYSLNGNIIDSWYSRKYRKSFA